MTKRLSLKAHGKINLGLDVLRKREDGYHEVCMIMQTVGIYDKIELIYQEKPGITLETNLYYLPTNENNLVYKAADLLMKEFKISGGIHINLKKFMCMSVLPTGLSVYYLGFRCGHRLGEGAESPRTGITGCCEKPCGCWELNQGPLVEWPVQHVESHSL